MRLRRSTFRRTMHNARAVETDACAPEYLSNKCEHAVSLDSLSAATFLYRKRVSGTDTPIRTRSPRLECIMLQSPEYHAPE